MVVRDPVTHRVVGTDDVQERGEEGECMSGQEKTFSEGRSRKQMVLPGERQALLPKILGS